MTDTPQPNGLLFAKLFAKMLAKMFAKMLAEQFAELFVKMAKVQTWPLANQMPCSDKEDQGVISENIYTQVKRCICKLK